MVMDSSDLRERHFAALKRKYQIHQHKSSSSVSDNFIYLILRKAELAIQITDIELQWLAENYLSKIIAELIPLQKYQAEDFDRLETEFLNLRAKYKIPKDLELSIDSPVYSILWKLDVGDFPTNSELKFLNNNYKLPETTSLIHNILNFSKLKTSYKANRHLPLVPEEPLYSILKKLDVKELLSDSEAEWLLENNLGETLEIYWQQEDERKALTEFSDLKKKYHINSFPEKSISSPLYDILKKLQEKQDLENNECKWLDQQKLTELIAIDRNRKDVKLFKKLKAKYQASLYKNSDPSSQLFIILKNLESEIIIEDEIRWLVNQNLLETMEIAKEIHFKILKEKYQMIGKLDRDPFYEIMIKLEQEERLDPKQFIQLIEEGRLSRHGKIATASYRLEAIFYEKEYQRTGNRWNLASASSNWRKANQPKNALQITEDIDWHKIKEFDLKSALWVTRGAAFRDLDQLDKAEHCAAEGMECQPENYQPYTLRGAIHGRILRLGGD